MNPEIFYQTETFSVDDNYVKHSIFMKNGAEWKTDRTAMSHHFTTSKLKSLINHFEGVTSNCLNNIAELNKENGGQPINVKPLLRAYGIDCISRFVFAIDCNSFKDNEWVWLIYNSGCLNFQLKRFLISDQNGLNWWNSSVMFRLLREFFNCSYPNGSPKC